MITVHRFNVLLGDAIPTDEAEILQAISWQNRKVHAGQLTF
jgi:hypothetical protein